MVLIFGLNTPPSVYVKQDTGSKDAFKGCGFAFVNFSSVEHSRNAVKKLAGLAVDKNHVLKAMLYSRLQSICQVSKEQRAHTWLLGR